MINSKVENYCCCSILNVHSTVKNLDLLGTGLVLISHISNLFLMGPNLCNCPVSDKELVLVTLFSSFSHFGRTQPMLKHDMCWEHHQIHDPSDSKMYRTRWLGRTDGHYAAAVTCNFLSPAATIPVCCLLCCCFRIHW